MEGKQEMPDMKRVKRNARPLSRLPGLLCGAFIALALGGTQMAAATNDASDLSNIPMEMRQNSAPASIMYILDDSGSMHDNRVSGNGSDLYDGTMYPVPAWLFANHFTNTLYYDPSREYAPWPGLEKGSFLPRIPLAKITAAPNWPEIPDELSTCKLPTDTTQPKRNTDYTAYNGKDGAGEKTRDLTATATWYTEPVPVYPSQSVYDYSPGTSSGSSITYTYNIPYGYFPGAAKDSGINLPVTHYFVCKDKSKRCTTVDGAPTANLTDSRIATDNELWLVVLRSNGNGAQIQRQFYKVSDLTPVPHISPSYKPYNPSEDPAILPQEDKKYTYELQKANLDGPYADAEVPDEVKPRWTRPDGSIYKPNPTEELENFLQWYVYHSTRNFVTINALATSLQELSGVNAGMYSINTTDYAGSSPKLRIGVMPVRVGDTDQSDYLLCRLYNYYAVDGTTPFAQAYETVGRYFDMSKKDDTFVVGDDQGKKKPYEDAASGGSCQQAFVINFTDGLFGAYPGTVNYIAGDLDGDGQYQYSSGCSTTCLEYAQYEYCPPHCDQYTPTTADGSRTCLTGYYYLPDKSDCYLASYCSNGTTSCSDPVYYPTISDLAKYYYDTDLAPDVPNYVPTTAHDKNSQQHLVTYSVALGVSTSLMTGSETAPGYAAYRDDPYFDAPDHNEPNWTNSGSAYPYRPSYATGGPNYLWHASVVSKGIFYNVSDAGALTSAFRSIVASIGASSLGVGAAAAVSNGGQLNDSSTIYVGRYDTSNWTGQFAAYAVSKGTGKIVTEMWEASAELKNRTDSRLIFTSDGKGKGLEFTTEGLNGLTAGQKEMLGYRAGDPSVFASNIDYIRGNNDISGLRVRGGNKNTNNVLGDIIHASPVLLRSAAMGVDPDPKHGTIYIGANDGMLHAFDVENGEERFAFIPSQAHDHLLALGDPNYVDKHRYYIDATPEVSRMTFFIDSDRDGIADRSADHSVTKAKDMRLLVSGLGRGGRGYFALDVAKAETISGIEDVKKMLQWEYPTRDMIDTPPLDTTDPYLDPVLSGKLLSSDTVCAYHAYQLGDKNPDGDGELRCAGPDGQQTSAYSDDDLGYSYSAPAIFPTNVRKDPGKIGLQLPNPADSSIHPWVVVFGNGYGSQSGRAVLYVLDALSGKLIKKIDTKSDPGHVNTSVKNGLSSPAELDIDGDGVVDFVYAGDLYGNLWKFDFRSKDPKDWDVVRDSAQKPQPLFSTMQNGQPGQPITSRPNIVAHNKKKGYIVVFGTGQFVGPADIQDAKTQSLFGIWDSDVPPSSTKLTKYLGSWNRGENGGSFPEVTGTFPNASLLKQEVIFQGTPSGAQCGSGGCPGVRVVSNNPIFWYNSSDSANFSHVGWYLDLPGLKEVERGSAPVSPDDNGSERIIDEVRIRYGKVIAVSFTPGEGICSAGGSSVLMELSAYTGGGPRKAQLNLGSGKLGVGDSFQFGGVSYVASGLIQSGKTTMPTIISGADPRTEYKVQFDNAGVSTSTLEERPAPIFFWREASRN